MTSRMRHAMRGRRATLFWIIGPYLWLAIPTILLFVGIGVWAIANKVATWTPAFVGPAAMFAAHAIATGIVARRSILVRRELRAVDGLACIGCGYPLSHEEPSGTCPECGRAHEAEAVRNGWRTIVPFDTDSINRRRRARRDKRLNEPRP